MKASKKKLYTSVVSLVLVAVIGVGAIVAVFAALVGHVSSGFNISYTASNVECVVSGSYSQKLGSQNVSLGQDIHFTPDDPDDTTKNFTNSPKIEFVNFSDFVEFHYTIQNLGQNSFNVSLSSTGLDNPNFKVEYTKNVRAAGDTTAKFDFNNGRVKLMDSYVTENGGPKEFLDIGIKISLIGKPTESATVTGAFNFTLDGLALPPADLWDDDLKQFNKENLDRLLKMISADPNASTTNMATVNTLATARTTADFFHNSVVKDDASGLDKKTGDVIVTLGGMTWHACYLSRAKGAGEDDGDVILTLWLTSSQQKMFEGMPAAEGDYYGFLNGSLYSDWSAHRQEDSTSVAYPSAMYGTSYMRAVTLNNGGEYATSGTGLSSYTKNRQSLFALFTMEEFGLTDYIVTPEKVSWQEYGQSAKSMADMPYNCSNDNWSHDLEKVPDDGFVSSNYNYAHKGEPYSAWAEDYLWLPSMSETGNNSGTHGIWGLRVSQRKNGTFSSSTSYVGRVGQINNIAYNHSWLRSGFTNTTAVANLVPAGSGRSYEDANYSCAVRPALHLNLTAAAAAANALNA